jgi:ribosome-associated translation inhibitor RaiA
MERSEALEDLTTDKVSQAIDGFLHRHDAHVQVWLVSDLNRTSRSNGSFICEIEVRYPRKKHFFIQKTNMDMHTAIQDASDKLRVLLDEAGKKELDMRQDRKADRQAERAAASAAKETSDQAEYLAFGFEFGRQSFS